MLRASRVLRAIARSLSPSDLSRNISLTLRIGTLSAGIGSPLLLAGESLCGSTRDRAPATHRVADFKSESVADFRRNRWPASNRNQRPTSNRNRWPTCSGIRSAGLQPSNGALSVLASARGFSALPWRHFWRRALIHVLRDGGFGVPVTLVIRLVAFSWFRAQAARSSDA